MMDDIKELVADLEQERQMAPINVELLDNELGIVYANSKKAEVRGHTFYHNHRMASVFVCLHSSIWTDVLSTKAEFDVCLLLE